MKQTLLPIGTVIQGSFDVQPPHLVLAKGKNLAANDNAYISQPSPFKPE